MRNAPNLKSRTITLLNNGDKISVLNFENKFKFIGRFYGRWAKIKFNKQIGFVFDSFISWGSANEKFHIFYTRFYHSFTDKRLSNFHIKRIKFPFIEKVIYINNSELKTIRNYSEFSYGCKPLKIKKYEGKPIFKIKGDAITVFIDIIGCGMGFVWYFKIINRKWYLVKTDRFSA